MFFWYNIWPVQDLIEGVMMLTPFGQHADNIEKVMLLSMWANHLGEAKNQCTDLSQQFIYAGLGKPTYPINTHTIKAYQAYWENMKSVAENWHLDPENAGDDCAINYGSPFGEQKAKSIMAKAMSRWYASEVSPQNVLFTVGGIGGLRIIFDVLNSFYAGCGKYRVITPFPHYSAYSNNPSHQLHPIDVMSEEGYQVSAKALESSIQSAYAASAHDNMPPKAILLCNPSNPLGTIIKKEELLKIAMVMRQHPELHIIFDEAYAEMIFKEMPSFINLAPDLKERTIILRSATKALSAAGERMAVIIAFDDYFISELVNQKITSYIHAPLSAQMAYAETMMHFKDHDRQAMSGFYKQKVDYVLQRIKNMGAEMPCASYQVDATFYALGDFSDMLGLDMPIEAEAALETCTTAQTGEDLAYLLLFKDHLMVAPLSYFGLDKHCGYLRITCSAKPDVLKEMMDRIEKRLIQGRNIKKQKLLDKIRTHHNKANFNSKSFETITSLAQSNPNALELKKQIVLLEEILTNLTAKQPTQKLQVV
tara:strand:+ start:811 stop:2418 length:1608 start_codon:yes stop_codon:yes gene_type:complete